MIELSTLNELQIPHLEPIRCNHFLDKILTTGGGLTPSTTNLIYGDPGAGKSTIVLEYAGQLLKDNPELDICFISAEMNVFQFNNLSKITPNAKNIPTIYFNKWEMDTKGKKMEDIYVELLDEGYDVIIIDSYVKVKETMINETKKSQKAIDSLIFDTMKKTSKGENKKGKYTSFLVIQQVTKGGVFVGKNNIAHDCDSNLKVTAVNSKERHLQFIKNRFSEERDKIYFEITSDGVKYNTEKIEMEKKYKEQIDGMSTQSTKLSKEDDDFLDSLINSSFETAISPNGQV